MEPLAPLIGLALCGGLSSRMGVDKSSLIYHGVPQREYLFEILKRQCERAYLSCNPDQEEVIDGNLPVLVDKFIDIGPIAALLTSFELFPDHSVLLTGCDYPFLGEMDLGKLVENRDGENEIIYYTHPGSEVEEPLIAIYENRCAEKLIHYYREGHTSLRRFIQLNRHKALIPERAEILESVDTRDEYETARNKLNKIA